jgi:DNA-binding LytR/AlgR family response regulator
MSVNSPSPTAIIADDEAPMREQLRARLQAAWPELRIVAEAANGNEAIALVAQHHPDIVFLDIRMPGKTGLEAARQLFSQTHIVFVTAYDQYAVEAFEQGAVDYLLKPVDPARLKTTCERLQTRLAARVQPTPEITQDMESMLTRLLQQQGQKRDYLRWIQASVGSTLRMIPPREVLFFRADDKYTCVQTEEGEFLIRKTLKELEDELDPAEFWRIHRSTMVRADAIVDVVRDMRGRQMLKVRHHAERLEVSRSHSHLFQQM